jgi:multidrug resistance efflux pump
MHGMQYRIGLGAFTLAIATAAMAQPALDTIKVAPREFAQTVAAEATIEAVKQATLGTQVAGRIVELSVRAGDTVRAGQVLASTRGLRTPRSPRAARSWPRRRPISRTRSASTSATRR